MIHGNFRRLLDAPLSRSMTALAIALVVLVSAARAEDYPSRNVTIIVPYAPGGTTDAIARLLAQNLEQRLGHTFIVESRPGSASIIGAAFVARAAPDGYTLLLGTSTTMAINVSMYKTLTYDPVKDFVPVALVAAIPFLLVLNPSLPVHSLDELAKYAKSLPQGLTYASNGRGGAAHLFAESVKSAFGIEMTHVPYKGLTPALTDVMAGHVDLMFCDFATALPLVRSGKLRTLGVSTAKRVSAAPDIPALSEVGMPGFDGNSWQMLVAPAAIPADVLKKLNSTIHDIMSEPAIEKHMSTLGLIPIATAPPDSLRSYVQSEIARWGKVVQHAGITPTE
jgi:tripartite-type tricarboxylate transporter receptor subunit TctC